jgi:hypothetical protein
MVVIPYHYLSRNISSFTGPEKLESFLYPFELPSWEYLLHHGNKERDSHPTLLDIHIYRRLNSSLCCKVY